MTIARSLRSSRGRNGRFARLTIFLLAALPLTLCLGCGDSTPKRGGSPEPGATGEGGISYEMWLGISGNALVSIPVDSTPDHAGTYTSLKAATDYRDSYGQRVRGFVTAPAAGYYVFWIASDDKSALWLSPNEDPANKQLIATVPTSTEPQQWDKGATQKSPRIRLVEGSRYYIEALHKEDTGPDHLAVGWSKPGQDTDAPSEVVPGSQLSPWVEPEPEECTSAAECDDSDPCTADDCVSGACQWAAAADGTPCDEDGNTCTDDVCSSGVCTHPDSAAECDDGDACTTGDVCSGGTCTGTQLDCDDGNVCTDDWCSAGVCQHADNSATCADDGDPCTDDLCSAGVCTHPDNGACAALRGEGRISYQRWTGISGDAVADIPLGPSADEVGYYSRFEGPTNYLDNYGQRVRGFLIPPTAGVYTFWIAGDDSAELWLSTDHNPSEKTLIASVPGRTASQQWNKFPEQQSAPVELVAGRRYYIEALHKDGVRADNLAVLWAKPGESTSGPSEVIPGAQLSPWEESAGNAFVERGGLVVMEAESFSGRATPANHQWNRSVDSSASGKQVVIANPNDGTSHDTDYVAESPRLDYEVVFSTPGTYYVWIRASAASSDDDSCHAGMDGDGTSNAAGISSFGTDLGWSRSTVGGVAAVVEVDSAGPHTVNIWMGEDGLRIDKILLTTDSSYAPSGAGPDQSAQSTCEGIGPENYPGNTEVCDGADNNCDGQADESFPEAGNACDTGLEGRCRGGIYECLTGALECVPTAATSRETCDGTDNDCNGQTDETFPGAGNPCDTGLAGVCAAGTVVCVAGNQECEQTTDASVEVCDGEDNDCDGQTDETFPEAGDACDTRLEGVCAAGTVACVAGNLECEQTTHGSDELCDGVDNDCNGQTDEAFPEAGDPCDTGLDGECAEGIYDCVNGALQCEQTTFASAELCDGLDNDCNGQVDETFAGVGDPCDTGLEGVCADGVYGCTTGTLQCEQTTPASAEVCDGLDNDCNGQADYPGELVNDDGDAHLSCTDCDDSNPSIGAPTGDLLVTFLVHGPPSAPTSSANGIYLDGSGELGTVWLEEVGPALWEADVALPPLSRLSYQYTRTGTTATSEVGPWGEAFGERTLNLGCEDVTIEDTVYNWDDETLSDTPAPADKGPTVSLVDYDSSSTATITVDLASAQNATLHYSTQPFGPYSTGSGTYPNAGQVLVNGSGSNHYEFNLTGLSPGTTYYYYVEYAGRVSTEYHWTTSSGADAYRFVAYGDSQDTTTALHEAHRDIVTLAYATHPDLVVRVGDQVNDGRVMSEWDYFFAIERPLLGSALYLTAIGNHEYRAANYFDLFALPPTPGSEEYYAFRYNNTLFVVLSTEMAVTGAQESWLQDTLLAASGDASIQWRVALFHRPAFSSGMHGSEPGVAAAWHDDFVNYGVDVVLNGHDHDYEHLLVDGIHYFVIGGGGAPLRAFSGAALAETRYREQDTYHYMVVDIDGGGLSLAVYRRDGSDMDGISLAATGG